MLKISAYFNEPSGEVGGQSSFRRGIINKVVVAPFRQVRSRPWTVLPRLQKILGQHWLSSCTRRRVWTIRKTRNDSHRITPCSPWRNWRRISESAGEAPIVSPYVVSYRERRLLGDGGSYFAISCNGFIPIRNRHGGLHETPADFLQRTPEHSRRG